MELVQYAAMTIPDNPAKANADDRPGPTAGPRGRGFRGLSRGCPTSSRRIMADEPSRLADLAFPGSPALMGLKERLLAFKPVFPTSALKAEPLEGGLATAPLKLNDDIF